MNTNFATPKLTTFLSVAPPPGWRHVSTPIGPGCARGDLFVLVSEEHDSDGRLWRSVSASRPKRAPSQEDLDEIVEAFLRDGVGPVDLYPAPNTPRMIMLARAIEPDDDEGAATAARMRDERRADVILEATLSLRSRRARMAIVFGCYAIVDALMPTCDEGDPIAHAAKAIGETLEKFSGPTEKVAADLRRIGVDALRDIEAVRPAPIEPARSRADAVDICVRILLGVARGEVDAAPRMAKVAARGLALPMATPPQRPRAMTGARDEAHAMTMLGDKLRRLPIGLDGWLWKRDAELLVAEAEERRQREVVSPLCFVGARARADRRARRA